MVAFQTGMYLRAIKKRPIFALGSNFIQFDIRIFQQHFSNLFRYCLYQPPVLLLDRLDSRKFRRKLYRRRLSVKAKKPKTTPIRLFMYKLAHLTYYIAHLRINFRATRSSWRIIVRSVGFWRLGLRRQIRLR